MLFNSFLSILLAIGDAYVVVAGVPVYMEDHADKVTSMAFSMQAVTKTVLSPVDGSSIKVGETLNKNFIVTMHFESK